MLGAFVYGRFCGENAAQFVGDKSAGRIDEDYVAREQARILAPLGRTEGITPYQFEYKTRRLVNDYLQPPKVQRKMEICLQRLDEIRGDIDALSAANPHELMRAVEAQTIRDCAEMAARASLFRTESRWGLYHLFVDHQEKDDANWRCHSQLKIDAAGQMAFSKREIEPYVVPIDDDEMQAYQRLRVPPQPVAA
jgi:succinate dehydrogenase/fumarate reductase flavoprotein subunit